MKGQGSRMVEPRPAPPLLDCLVKAQEYRPKLFAEWPSCHEVLMSRGSKSANTSTSKGAPGLMLNNGETISAPRSLEFGGNFWGFFESRSRSLTFNVKSTPVLINLKTNVTPLHLQTTRCRIAWINRRRSGMFTTNCCPS